MLAVSFQRCRISDEPRRSALLWSSVEFTAGKRVSYPMSRCLTLFAGLVLWLFLTTMSGIAHAEPKFDYQFLNSGIAVGPTDTIVVRARLTNTSTAGETIGSFDTNAVFFVSPDGQVEELPLLSKAEVAAQLLDRIGKLRDASR